jgi:hypothetical protein
MDIAVHTGVTKGGDETSVLSLSFTSKNEETVILLLQVAADERSARTLEQECKTVVQHALLETEGETWNRLDGTLKELNGLMKGLLLSRAVEEVHAIAAIVDKEGMLHVSSAGRGEAYLVRGGQASQITEYTRGKPVSAFVHISSGTVEAQDTVVFATQRLLRAFTPAQLAQTVLRGHHSLQELTGTLDDEGEQAAVAVLHAGGIAPAAEAAAPARSSSQLPSRRQGRRSSRFALSDSLSFLGKARAAVAPFMASALKKGAAGMSNFGPHAQKVREKAGNFFADLKDPVRKKRAHLLILAAAVTVFLVIFLVVKLTTNSQRSKTQAELGTLVQKINDEIKTADNRRLAGDTDAANEILQRADAWAKQVMDNESGLFRVQALDLLDKIRSKSEEINNIVRLSPRVLVNLTSKNSDISAQGLVGIADGEFIVYDRQSWYHVLLNGVDDGKKLVDDGLIIDGTALPRYKVQVFMTTGNSVVELQGSQPTSMKTEDPAGWVTGKDIEGYLRYVYVLTADNKIFKYERLTNRYGTASQYNVSGDLTGALDMTIDSSVYVLKEGGAVVKLFRGEAQPFAINHVPVDAFKTATKILKVSDSNFYFLDPAKSRVIVASDGGADGQSSYLRQYVLEGDQIGKLQDFYVDPEESHLYVADEKRVYVIDLVK